MSETNKNAEVHPGVILILVILFISLFFGLIFAVAEMNNQEKRAEMWKEQCIKDADAAKSAQSVVATYNELITQLKGDLHRAEQTNAALRAQAKLSQKVAADIIVRFNESQQQFTNIINVLVHDCNTLIKENRELKHDNGLERRKPSV